MGSLQIICEKMFNCCKTKHHGDKTLKGLFTKIIIPSSGTQQIRQTPKWSSVNFDHQLYNGSGHLMQSLPSDNQFHYRRQIDSITLYWDGQPVYSNAIFNYGKHQLSGSLHLIQVHQQWGI